MADDRNNNKNLEKTNELILRFSDAERQKIELAASLSDMSVEDYVTQSALEVIDDDSDIVDFARTEGLI